MISIHNGLVRSSHADTLAECWLLPFSNAYVSVEYQPSSAVNLSKAEVLNSSLLWQPFALPVFCDVFELYNHANFLLEFFFQEQSYWTASLEVIFQEQSYWAVQLGRSLALDYSRRCLSGWPCSSTSVTPQAHTWIQLSLTEE